MTDTAFRLPADDGGALDRALAALAASTAQSGRTAFPDIASASRARLEGALDRLLRAVAEGLVAALPRTGARIDGLGRALRARFRSFGLSLVRGVLDDLQSALAEALGEALPALLGARAGSSGGLGGTLLRAVLPSLGGGAAFPVAPGGVPISPFGGLARGGRVAPGRAFLVGEAGPELFVPSTAGEIVPNERLAAAAPSISVVQNFDLRGADLAAVAALRREAARIKRELVAEIAASARRGGAFARLPRV